MTFKVTDESGEYVLRIHKPVNGFSLGILQGRYDAIEYLRGEIDILVFLHENTDIPVQTPITNKMGEYITILDDGTPATLLEWVGGTVIESTKHTPELMYAIGKMTSTLHMSLRNMQVNNVHKCIRYNYGKPLLDEISGQVLEMENLGQINGEQTQYMFAALEEIKVRMDRLDCIPNAKGIVHSDLSPSNMIYNSDKIIPIDFSLCGYSYIYMDLGSLLCHFTKPEDQKAIIAGYECICGYKVDIYFVEPFYAMQVLLFIACQHDKSYKYDWFPGAIKRWCDTIFIPLSRKEIFLTQ